MAQCQVKNMPATPLFERTLAQLDASSATRGIRSRLTDPAYDKEFGEKICTLLFELCKRDDAAYTQAVNDFIHFSLEFLQLQVELDRTGSYKLHSYQDALEMVYNNPDVMAKRYLHGLLLSQAFWINHYKIFHFFRTQFCETAGQAMGSSDSPGSVLEVPIGTGIFLSEFKRTNPTWNATGHDISESAIKFAQNIVRIENSSSQHIEITKQNVFDLPEGAQYNAIICGELLEHLENPQALLKKLQALLRKDGKLFLTTAIWAASIDHIYLFRSAQEVREMLEQYFVIEQELVLPVFADKKPEEPKTPINYACILVHKPMS